MDKPEHEISESYASENEREEDDEENEDEYNQEVEQDERDEEDIDDEGDNHDRSRKISQHLDSSKQSHSDYKRNEKGQGVSVYNNQKDK